MLREVGYDHPDVVTLTAEVQRYYATLYGEGDETPVDPTQFVPPRGRFLLGTSAGVPVVMGGWRFAEGLDVPGRRAAELKRMFVAGSARGRGYARRVLAALEDAARAAGADWMVLESGRPQEAALALYRSAGYRTISDFGHYAGEDEVVSLGRPLLGAGD